MWISPTPGAHALAILAAFAVVALPLFPRITMASMIVVESAASGSAIVANFVTPGCECEVNSNRVQVFRELNVDERGVAEFDISALNANSVGSAEVALAFNRFSNPSNATRTWDIAAYAGDGLLGIDDWGAGVDIVTGTQFSGEPVFSFDVTSTLIDHVQAGNQFIGFTIRQREEIENSSADFFAAVQLLVAVPEPSTPLLLSLCLAGLVVVRRRG